MLSLLTRNLHILFGVFIHFIIGVDSEKCNLNIGELINYGSVEEIINEVTKTKVESILRGSPEDWKKSIYEYTKIDINTVISSWEDFYEVFLRRNVIVHNRGVVNKHYLKKLRSDWLNSQPVIIEEGDLLLVTEGYFSKAFSTFLVTGINLCDLFWRKFKRDKSEERELYFSNLVYQLLKKGEWYSAKEVCNYHIKSGIENEDVKTAFMLNRWLCFKKLGLYDQVSEEITNYDIDHWPLRWQMCYYALTNQKNSFFTKVKGAMSEGVTKRDLYEWPIIDEMRDYEEFMLI